MKIILAVHLKIIQEENKIKQKPFLLISEKHDDCIEYNDTQQNSIAYIIFLCSFIFRLLYSARTKQSC